MDSCDKRHCKHDRSGRTLKKAKNEEFVPIYKNIVFYFMVTDTIMCAKDAVVKLIQYLPEENSQHAQLLFPHMLEPKSERFIKNVVLDADSEVRFFDPKTREVVDSLGPTPPTHRVMWRYLNEGEKVISIVDRKHSVSKNDLLRRPADLNIQSSDGEWVTNDW